MIELFLLPLLAAGQPSAFPPPQVPAPLTVDARGVGTFTVSGRLVGSEILLSCVSQKGTTLFETHFAAPEFGGNGLFFSVHSHRGLPAPIIVASVDYTAADGFWLEIALIAPVNGHLRELFPRHLLLRGAEDGLCIGSLGPGKGLGIALWRHILGTDGVVPPHRYSVVVYRWSSQSRFVAMARAETQGHHPTWQGAAEELGFACSDCLDDQAK